MSECISHSFSLFLTPTITLLFADAVVASIGAAIVSDAVVAVAVVAVVASVGAAIAPDVAVAVVAVVVAVVASECE